jgi:hypothetical protein
MSQRGLHPEERRPTVPVSLLLVTSGMNPAKGKGAISSTAHSAERGTILHRVMFMTF